MLREELFDDRSCAWTKTKALTSQAWTLRYYLAVHSWHYTGVKPWLEKAAVSPEPDVLALNKILYKAGNRDGQPRQNGPLSDYARHEIAVWIC